MLYNLEKIYKYIEIIKESGIPVEHLTSIDVDGSFKIKEPQCSDEYQKYTGKVINNGVLAIYEQGSCYPSDFDCYTTTCLLNLEAHNIDGYNFKASTYATSLGSYSSIEKNTLKIASLYEHYKIITKALDSGLDDDYIKEEYGLESFKSEKSINKQKVIKK